MARLTKLRARQTRAAEEYSADDFNLATDGEVETRVRKHSALFHHNRNDKTEFTFNAQGDLIRMEILTPNGIDLLQQTDFVYDINGNMTTVIKEVFDEDLNQYVKLQKDFNFDGNGNISSIDNNII